MKRVFLMLIPLGFLLVFGAAPTARAAQSPLPGAAAVAPTVPAPIVPAPAFDAPAEASTFRELAPAGVRSVALPGSKSQRTVGPHEDLLLSFANEQVGIYLESGTFSGPATLAYETLRDAAYDRSNPGTQLLLSFHLAWQSPPTAALARQTRLMVDLRSRFGGMAPPNGRFFLARRSAEDPAVWVDVPIEVHDPAGLFSADVTALGEWQAGLAPERWSPMFNHPAVSAYSGAATFSYDIEVPAGRAGLQPAVTLSYSSRALDGRIHNHSSVPAVADGWSLAEIAVVREGVRMGSNAANQPASILPERFRLLLGGSGHRLVPVGSGRYGGLRFAAEGAPDLYVERHDLSVAGLRQRFFWTLITGSGTMYRLGYAPGAEAWQRAPHAVHLEFEPEDLPYRWAGTAWAVDLVVDPLGNQLRYDYLQRQAEEVLTWEDANGSQTILMEHQRYRLSAVSYNFEDIPEPDPGLRWPDLPAPRTAPGSRVSFRAASDDVAAGSFSDSIDHIYVIAGPAGRPLAEYRLDIAQESVLGACDDAVRTRVVRSIQRWAATDADPATDEVAGAFALPPTTLSYVSLAHYLYRGAGCFYARYLAGVDNGYGGAVQFTYQSDGRVVGDYVHTPISRRWPEVGFSYVVAEKTLIDSGSAVARTTFAYQAPCYGQYGAVERGDFAGARGCGDPDIARSGPLLGFDVASETMWDGAAMLGRAVTTFGQSDPQLQWNEQARGRPVRLETHDANGALVRTRTQTLAIADTPVGPGFLVSRRTEEQVRDPVSGGVLTRAAEAHFIPGLQGGAQFGNQTAEIDLGNVALVGDEITTVTCFFPNTASGHWLVNKPGLVRTFKGALATSRLQTALCTDGYRSDDLLVERRILYDGRGADGGAGLGDYWTPPRVGLLTQELQGRPGTPLGGAGSGLLAGTRVEYDAFGNAVRLTEPAGAVTTVSYDGRYHLFPVRVSRSATALPTLTTTYQLYGVDGVARERNGVPMPLGAVARVDDPNGRELHVEWDPFGRLFATYDSAAEAGRLELPWDGNPRRRLRYWDNGWNDGALQQTSPFAIADETFPAVFGSGTDAGLETITYHDGFGRVIQQRDRRVRVDGALQDVIVLQAYDARGRQACSAVPFAVSTRAGLVSQPCSDRPHVTWHYDSQGRLWQEVTPAGARTEHRYNVDRQGVYHNVIDANGHRVKYSHDAHGWMTTVQTFSGNCGPYWGFGCDAGDAPWSNYAATTYSYTPLGQLARVTDDAGHVTRMTYDPLGRRTALLDPDLGSWSYAHDAAGQLIRQRDARGQVTCQAYDGYGRLSETWESFDDSCTGGSNTRGSQWLATYEYDVQVDGTPALGLVTRVSWAPDGMRNGEAFFYDQRLRPQTQRRIIDGAAYDLNVLEYDLLDRPVQVRFPGGETVTYAYDAHGAVGMAVDGQSLIKEVAVNARGMLTALHYGNGVTAAFEYAAAAGDFRLEEIVVERSRDQLLQLRYGYDQVGNVTQIVELGEPAGRAVSGGAGAAVIDQQQFAYDHLDRLVQATGDRRDLDYAHEYHYDALGNLTVTQDLIRRSTRAYAYGAAQPHAVAAVGADAFVYDANGNMVYRQQAGVEFRQHFDVANRLASVRETGFFYDETTFFAYDAAGQRVKRTAPDGTVTHYPFSNVAVRQPGTAAEVVETTLAFRGQAVALLIAGGDGEGLYHLHSDHLGSAQLLTYGGGEPAAGEPVAGSEARYFPFGEERLAPELRLGERGFTGHRAEPDLGLVYMNARYYVAGIGRFASADPIVADPYNGQSLNRYSYVGNNPLRFVDPTGNCATVSVFDGSGLVEQPDPADSACWDQYNYLRFEIGLSPEEIGYGHEYEARGAEEFAIMRALYEQRDIEWSTLLAHRWKLDLIRSPFRVCDLPVLCINSYELLSIEQDGTRFAVMAENDAGEYEHLLQLESQGEKLLAWESTAAAFVAGVDAARGHLMSGYQHVLAATGARTVAAISAVVGLVLLAPLPFVGVALLVAAFGAEFGSYAMYVQAARQFLKIPGQMTQAHDAFRRLMIAPPGGAQPAALFVWP